MAVGGFNTSQPAVEVAPAVALVGQVAMEVEGILFDIPIPGVSSHRVEMRLDSALEGLLVQVGEPTRREAVGGAVKLSLELPGESVGSR
jgi:hypothetical protein